VKKGNMLKQPLFSICWRKGKVQLPRYKKCSDYLFNLLDYHGGRQSSRFRESIHAYNLVFAFTSMGGNIDGSVNSGKGLYVFHTNG